MSDTNYEFHAGKFKNKINAGLKKIDEQHIIERIKKHDHTVWKADPGEITNRLGWLNSPEITGQMIPEIDSFVAEICQAKFSSILLLGMGGSSLAPEVLARMFGRREGYPALIVLDTTDPDTIHAVEAQIDLKHTFIMVATKSGGTVETISLMKYFYNRVIDIAGPDQAGSFFGAITDPGSGLEQQAKILHFRKVFLNDPTIGGRYSALSLFGMVPAALTGIDISLILKKASDFARQTLSKRDRSAVMLGTALGILAGEGRDKLTLIGEAHWQELGPWIEQLIAESTGKEGKGILPVVHESKLDPAEYTVDRSFIFLANKDKSDLNELKEGLIKAGHPVVGLPAGAPENIGIQFYMWEMATIIAGHFLQINPFDQPNVESAKVKARKLMEIYRQTGKIQHPQDRFSDRNFDFYGEISGANPAEIVSTFINSHLQPGGYIAIHAYTSYGAESDAILFRMRDHLRNKFKITTTIGYGPRFLHSTGQLHKGDAGKGIFLQILSKPVQDKGIPDVPGKKEAYISFGTLKNAQAFGDREALISSGRKVLTLVLKNDLKDLISLI